MAAFWLEPSGKLHPVDPISHNEWLEKNTDIPHSKAAMEKGWHRIYEIGKSIYAHNEYSQPNYKQKQALEDMAIHRAKDDIIHTANDKEKTLWSIKDMFQKNKVDVVQYSQSLYKSKGV